MSFSTCKAFLLDIKFSLHWTQKRITCRCVYVSDVEYKLFIFHVLLLEATTTVSMFFLMFLSILL